MAKEETRVLAKGTPSNQANRRNRREKTQIKAITGFVTKLKDDLDAVRNRVTYKWSNGQVEGQINRLKMQRASNVRSCQSRTT